MDRTAILKGGFKNLLTGVPLQVDRQPFGPGEKAPSTKIESLDDEKDQEEVRQIVEDIEAPRSDDALPVRPRDV